jgi:transposase
MKGIGTEELEVRRYSEALKLQVVKELDEGCLTVGEAMEFYDIRWRKTINRWQRRYGKDNRKTKVVRVLMKSEQQRIRELEKALADKELDNIKLRAQLEAIEERYGEDIKKKLSPERYSELERLGKETGLDWGKSAKRSG